MTIPEHVADIVEYENWRSSDSYSRNKQKYRERHLMKYEGMTLEVYSAMGRDQGCRCAICRTPESKLRRRLVVDHCELTGAVRGLLCDKCNLALGSFGHSSHTLSRAAEYLTSAWEQYDALV